MLFASIRRHFPAVLLVVAAASCSTPGRPDAERAAERSSDPSRAADLAMARTSGATPAVRPIETFDAVWTTVRDQHFDPSLNGVDWEAVRAELRPRMELAETQDEARSILMDMLSRLGQSHFTIIPAELAERSPVIGGVDATDVEETDSDVAGGDSATSAPSSETAAPVGASPAEEIDVETTGEPGTAGIDVAIVDGVPTVLRITPGLPASDAGVRAGWRLAAVDGEPLEPVMEPLERQLGSDADPDSPHARQLRAQLGSLAGALVTRDAGARLEVSFEDVDGATHDVELAFEPAPYGTTKFGNLPPFPVEVESRLVERRAPAGRDFRIGVIGFNIWMTAAMPAIDRAIDEFRRTDGIVIDLRGNPGGVGAMSMGVAGHFLQEPTSLGAMIGRDTRLEFRANPRKVSTENRRVRPYAKPLAILVDGRTASTSEVFAAGLQGLGRARVFGETSAGMALPAQAVELPSGDVLLHAVADFTTPSGTRIEGVGVIPDEPATPTRRALSEGHDAALEAAIAWIAEATMAARSAREASDAKAPDAPNPTAAP